MIFALPTPLDLKHKIHLHQLAVNAHPPPSNFRVRAWRWHHLGVERDLSRVEATLRARKTALCVPGGARVSLLDVLTYVIDDNWKLHNHVEKTLFIPWIMRHAGNDPILKRNTLILEKERQRLMKDTHLIMKQVEQWVNQTESQSQCTNNVLLIANNLRKLRQDSTLLFRASENLFIPKVVQTFSQKQQNKFNDNVLKSITGRQARVSLVVFRDAVRQEPPVVATTRDEQDFYTDIPAPIRKWGVPFWRGKFVRHKTRFLTEDH